MNDKLKPCPRCGGDALGLYARWEYDTIECVDCGLTMEAQGQGDYWRKKLIKDWNSSPVEDALQAEIARYKKLEEVLDDLRRLLNDSSNSDADLLTIAKSFKIRYEQWNKETHE